MENKTRTFLIFAITCFMMLGVDILAQSNKDHLDDHRKKWNIPATADELKNPLKGNASATENGKVLYQKNCSVCHGSTGKGDGIAASGLAVAPADHTSLLVQGESDGSLFYDISGGHAPMPAYKTILTETQHWELVNYIRTLKVIPKSKSHK